MSLTEDTTTTSLKEVRDRFKRKKRVAKPPDVSKIRKVIGSFTKEQLAGNILEADDAYNGMLKQAILAGRIDILATHVLGLECTDLHRQLLAYQQHHPQSLQLVFRGAGKTTILSVAKGIWYICKNPDLRILITSRTYDQAKSILKEIKHHLMFNEQLITLFGEFAPTNMNDPSVVWNEREINVLQRKHHTKESNFTALGSEGAVVGKHYDVELVDDLVDEENSRTAMLRDRINKFYYKTLDPCLEPPDDVEHRGERHIIGTRYHPEDLYGHLKDKELKDHTQVIPALTQIDETEDGHPVYVTPWSEKFSIEFFLKKRKDQGPAIFDSQYQCDIETMRGEVFKPEWFDHEDIFYDTIPADAHIWTANDLAISTKKTADKFASVTIARHKDLVYLVDFVWGRFGFNEQAVIIGERFLEQDPIRTGVEAVAYQAAQLQNLKDKYPVINGRVVPIYTKLDKLTRAWKLTSIFESKLVRISRSHKQFIDHMVAFREGSEDDLFDAFEMAVTLSTRGVKKRREKEPGLF